MNLEYTGNETYYIKPTSTIYKQLTFTLICHSYSDMSLSITDANNTRFRIPSTAPFPEDPMAKSTYPINLSSFNITVKEEPFEFYIFKNPDRTLLFDTTNLTMVFSKHYI